LEFEETNMRDHMINEAQSREAYGRWSWVMRVVTNWRARKTLKQLQTFSDYQLRDIGLTRSDLNRFIHLPLDTDIVWEAERRALIDAKNRQNAALALPALGRAASPWLQVSAPVAAAKLKSQTKIQRGTFAA
jgi:uncharacterized protein YjiS (DUF1127 family)